MSFWKALAWIEMQTTTSRIWTQIVDSITYEDIRYDKGASLVKDDLQNSTKPKILGYSVQQNSTELQILGW